MNTDTLIQELGRELPPVRRLLPPGQRAALWLACGVAYVAAMLTLAWIRRGTPALETEGPYLLQQGALVLACVLSALAAFASVVPGAPNRARAMLAVPIVVMMSALVWGLSRDLGQFGTAGFGRETDWPCVASITLGGVGLWGVAAAMLRRGAALEPRVTTALAGVAAISLANVEACVSRAHAFTATVVAWHGLTIAVLMVALMTLGPRVLIRRSRIAS